GINVVDQKITLPQSGYFTLDYQLNETAPTGLYTANLFLVKDNKIDALLGSTDIRVEEFLPDRLKMQANFNPVSTNAGWLSPNNLAAQVKLWNLFGTAATNRRVTGKIVLAPQDLSFSNYEDYTFIDPLIDPNEPPKTFSENLTDQTTDAN